MVVKKLLLNPPIHRGMKELDREAFNIKLRVMALRIPAKEIGKIKNIFGEDLLRVSKLCNVINDDTSKTLKKILLRPEIGDDLVGASNELKYMVEAQGWDILPHEITVGYDHWSADEILKAVLPDPTQAPTSYEQVGHIAHMNLREEYIPFKKLIGQVILDKSPVITMVVNKLDTIDNTYRNFNMEILAGEGSFVTQVRENDCKFRFDFSKVYWNSRLHPEHERLIKLFSPTDTICDVMAGVGPFAVPAAKRGALVWANDLNPASYESLEENIKINKVQTNARAFNMDGRDFICRAFKEYYSATARGPLLRQSTIDKKQKKTLTNLENDKSDTGQQNLYPRTFDHVVMNLPAIALEFLDAFRGLFNYIIEAAKEEGEVNLSALKLPLIHAHCFTKSDNPEKDILQRACRAMGYPESEYKSLDANIHYVRKVAPNKDMYCLSLRLPKSIAYAKSNVISPISISKRKLDRRIDSGSKTKKIN